MSILCLWTPDLQIDGERTAELTPVLLREVPRLVVEERGVVWADVRGLPGERLARVLIERLEERGVKGVRAGIARAPIVAEGAARFGDARVVAVKGVEERAYQAPFPHTQRT